MPPCTGHRCPRSRYVDPGRRNWATDEPSWGIFGAPESEVGFLPDDLDGKDAIELGCGTAYVSVIFGWIEQHD